MTEFAPKGSNVKMTKAQVKVYVKNMKAQQKKAKQKLEEAKASGEFDETKELEKLEKQLEEL